MFIAVIGICISLTITALYLIFYPLSERSRKFWESFNYQGLLIMVFSFTFAFIGSEFVNKKQYFYILFVTFCVFVACLILVQYEVGRPISFWISVGYISTIFVLDCFFFSVKR